MSLASGLPQLIDSKEQAARFLRQSSYVVKSSGRIKHNAFLPAPDHDTSVFRIEGIDQRDVQALAKEHVKERSKNGAAIFRADVVSDAKLHIEAQEPPPRHANIRAWSMNDDPDLRKSERKTAAMVLAEESKWMNWT